MKKNIFISVALIVLAVLAGCTPQSNYPAFPTSVSITQPGSFIKGQDFDASKFSVVVTYLDGSKQTINNAGLTYADTKSDGVSTDDTVTYFAGYDYQNNKVEQTVNISNVYAVDYITATTSKTSFTEGDADSQDFTVTAYFGGTNEVLGANNYTVTVSEALDAKDAEDYAEATSVKGVATVTLDSKLGGNITKVDVTVSKKAAVEPSGVVEKVNSVASSSSSFTIPAYDYNGVLPEIDGSKVLINVKFEGEDAARNVAADTVDGIELFWADPVTGDKLDTAYVNTNFAAGASAKVENSGIAVGATYNGEAVSGLYTVPVAKTSITLQYSGAKLVLDTPYSDIELSAEDFRALLYLNDEYAETLAIEDDMLALPATGKVEGSNVTVTLTYNGLTATTTIETVAKGAVKPVSVTAVLADFEAPVAVVYDAAPTAPTAADVESVTVTYSDNTTKTIKNADFASAVTVAYSLSNTETEAVGAGADLRDAKLYMAVTYTEDEAVTAYVPVTVGTPEVATVELEAAYTTVKELTTDPMIGSKVEYTLTVKAAEGTIYEGDIADYTGEYLVFIGGVDATALPLTVGETAVSDIRVQIDGVENATAVSIAAGEGYINGENIKVTVAVSYIPYIDDAISTTVGDYAIVEGSWTEEGEGATAPEIKSIKLRTTGAIVTANTTATAVVEYVDSTGKTVQQNVIVEIKGTAWVEGESSSATLKYGDDLLSTTSSSGTEIPAGTYTWEDFTSSLVEHDAEATFTATGIAGDFTPASNGFSIGQFADGSITMTWTNKTGEQSKTFYVHGGAAPAEEA